MPIQFRCPHCTRLLGVARRKAGAQVRCPRCGRPATVPGGPGSGPFDGLDDDPGPARAVEPAARPGWVPSPQPAGAVAEHPARPAADRPLFEADDLDAILGVQPESRPFDLDDPPAGPKPVSGPDAATLPDDGYLTLSRHRATALGVVMAVLLILAFALGVLVGARW
jgi:hypothetical protein